MNWISLLTLALKLVVPATQAIEQLATEAHSGADKKQIAVDSILQGANVAGAVLNPEDAQKAAAIGTLVGHAVDATVAASKLQAPTAAKVAAVAETATVTAAESIAIAKQA